MGASGWDYRVPYVGSVEKTFIAVQEQILADGGYIWPWEDIDPDFVDGEPLPRPSSLEALRVAKVLEEYWEEGTHTLLDIDRVISGEGDEFGAVRLLVADELSRLFGTEQPTAADFDRVYRSSSEGPLLDLLGDRWSGRSMVIYDNGSPAEVFFWGSSGD